MQPNLKIFKNIAQKKKKKKTRIALPCFAQSFFLSLRTKKTNLSLSLSVWLLDFANPNLLKNSISNSINLQITKPVLLNPRHVIPHFLSYHLLHHRQELVAEELLLVTCNRLLRWWWWLLRWQWWYDLSRAD